MRVRFVDLGQISFEDAFALQQETVERVARRELPETVHLLEHPHVYTVGRRGWAGNLLAEQDDRGRPLKLIRINRGGDVTYHGPGQLVCYPHLDLRPRNCDLHDYLRKLEAVVMHIAGDFGVESYRRAGLTGVWTKRGKLASIGVGVRRWITMHGLALNVDPDLRYFGWIHPCGIPDCPMTSLSLLTGRIITLEEVKPVLKRAFAEVFEL